MKIGRLFPDLLATLGRAASPEAGFARTLRQLVTLSGAIAGGLRFLPGRGAPIDVTAGPRRGSGLELWARERLAEPVRGTSLRALREPPSGWRSRERAMHLRACLGDRARPLGHFSSSWNRCAARGRRAGPAPAGSRSFAGEPMIRTLLIVAATALLGLLLVAGGPVSSVVPSLTPSVATGRAAISISPAPSAEDELSLAEPALGAWLTQRQIETLPLRETCSG